MTATSMVVSAGDFTLDDARPANIHSLINFGLTEAVKWATPTW